MKAPLQIVSVIAVIFCDGKYLLVQRSHDDDIFPGKWQSLGGKVEVGEYIEQALKREIAEEVGLQLETLPLFIQSYSWKKDDQSPTRLGIIFLYQLPGKPEDYAVKISDELTDFGWFTVSQASNLDLIGTKRHRAGVYGQLIQAEHYRKGHRG